MRRVAYYKELNFDGKKYWGYRIRRDGTYEESYGFKSKLAAMRDYQKYHKEDHI